MVCQTQPQQTSERGVEDAQPSSLGTQADGAAAVLYGAASRGSSAGTMDQQDGEGLRSQHPGRLSRRVVACGRSWAPK